MEGFSKKEYLSLKMPTEEVPVSDQKRIELALNTLGYETIVFPLKVLRKLYPLCRKSGFDITVTLVHGEFDWVVTDVEAGNTAAHHYGLAVDYGSTTIVMQLVDLHSGAVDSVRVAGPELTFTTIGGQKPVGICGSGIIDLLAQMRAAGWIDISGALEPGASPSIRYLPEEKEYAVVYAAAEEAAGGIPLYFSQTDIRQYLDTKAAAYTMVDCLLESAGMEAGNLAHIYLSGAFAAHSDLESAITIGMFPDLPREKYTVLKNSSLDGARTVLLDHSRLAEAKAMAENIYCVQFASIPDFLIRMQAAKFIPHTDRNRFPSVAI